MRNRENGSINHGKLFFSLRIWSRRGQVESQKFMLFRFFINDNDDKNVLQILLENVLESKFKNFLIWIDKNK